MSIPIRLPNGQTVVIDEKTGNILTDGGTGTGAQGPGAFGNQERTDMAQPYLGTPPGDTGSPPFDPNVHRVTDRVSLPGGTQVSYTDGQNTYTTFIPDKQDNSGAGVSWANLSQRQNEFNYQQQADQANRDEQKRQFDETMGYNKARFDTEISGHDAAGNPTENRRQFDASQELTKGNTLLGLGSHPDTLIKYLYALRGQQTPQGIQNTTANLPGYQNVLGQTNYGQPAPQPAPQLGGNAAPALPGTPPSGADPRVTAVRSAIGNPQTDLSQFVSPGGTNITQADPRQSANPVNNPTAPYGNQDALIAAGRKPRFFSDGVAIFKHGGPIPEHVIGVGLKSGKTYEFGEDGPEYVVPNDKMADLMGVLHKAGREDAGGNKSYDTGGQIGFNPNVYQGLSGFGTNGKLRLAPNDPDAAGLMAKYPGRYEYTSAQNTAPTRGLTFGASGQVDPISMPRVGIDPGGIGTRPTPPPPNGAPQPINPPPLGIDPGGLPGNKPLPPLPGASPVPTPQPGINPGGVGRLPSGYSSLFNPQSLRDVVARGYNSNPATPLFPQIGHFTGQGSSFIPSAQKLSNSTGAERSLYSGALQDEFGLVPSDVFELASKMGPQISGVRTPRYA